MQTWPVDKNSVIIQGRNRKLIFDKLCITSLYISFIGCIFRTYQVRNKYMKIGDQVKEVKKVHTDLFVYEYEDGSLDIGYYEVSEQTMEPVLLFALNKN